ncbi:DsbA family protein [Pedomonas mirosovicensis]|uniref:DsbA family protein n=1 Tax=Pedomonas mirosovicensis TaxID=2908641 RepID=UPI0021699DF1|nr:DsbA family protein [Pedomonas mirosovicensis]MCH8685154.1 DsbA family protein [Pedomonas mirosovicensis]
MKQRTFWLAAIAGVVFIALAAEMLSRMGGGGPGVPLALSPEAFFEDATAPQHTPEQHDLTIVVYSDYQCPHCRRADAALQTLLREDPRIRVVYRDWPLLGPASLDAARFAIASQWQGRHGAFHTALMESPGRLGDETIRRAAAQAGVDWQRLEEDLAAHEDEIDALLARNATQAAQLGLVGTPGFLIGRYRVPGAIDLPTMRDIVRRAREDATARAAGAPPR